VYSFVNNDGINKWDLLGESVWAIIIPFSPEVREGKSLHPGTSSAETFDYAKEQIKERVRLAKIEKSIVEGWTDDYWEKKVKVVKVYFKGKEYTHEGLSRQRFLEWLSEEESGSEVKVQYRGKEKALKQLVESFGSKSSYDAYPYHQKMIGQHSYGGYPGGTGEYASKVVPEWDFSTCGVTGIGHKTKWRFVVSPFGHDEEECILYFYPLWIEEKYYDDKGRPVNPEGNQIE